MKKKSLRNLKDLAENSLIQANEIEQLEPVIKHFSFALTNQMQQLIEKTDKNDPIRKQFIPSIEELTIQDQESDDPIGDDTHAKVKGLVHRYPDRCLLMPIKMCPVYCRFCFRREKVSLRHETLSKDALKKAYEYIETHPEIWEVILTGGDPMILKPVILKKIIDCLSAIPHVEIIRIHTRVPVVASDYITYDMIQALQSSKTTYIVLHANHPNELTKDAEKAIGMLIDAGIPLLSQTVLLKNINDNIATLSTLMRQFVKLRIKPYYLHHPDLAKGTSHFRVTIKKGQKLMKDLRGKFSGLCQPTYVLDIPGGFGKVPIGPNYILEEKCDYCIEDYHGNIHKYKKILAK